MIQKVNKILHDCYSMSVVVFSAFHIPSQDLIPIIEMPVSQTKKPSNMAGFVPVHNAWELAIRKINLTIKRCCTPAKFNVVELYLPRCTSFRSRAGAKCL